MPPDDVCKVLPPTSSKPLALPLEPRGPRQRRREMRIVRFGICLILALVGVSLQAQSTEQPITVSGKLDRAMAIGGESTGWTLELDSPTTVDGKQVSSIQVRYHKAAKLEKLQ